MLQVPRAAGGGQESLRSMGDPSATRLLATRRGDANYLPPSVGRGRTMAANPGNRRSKSIQFSRAVDTPIGLEI
jgi:hypothetical protein